MTHCIRKSTIKTKVLQSLTGSGDPALRTAQCEHFTEQYDDTGQKFRGGTGRNQCQCSEWLVEEGNIVHTIRNGVAFMNTKDTDQIMDYLEVNLADAVAGVNKNLQEITYSSENMSTETKGVLQSIGKLQQNMRQFRV